MSKQTIFDELGHEIGKTDSVPSWGSDVTNAAGDKIGNLYPDQEGLNPVFDNFGEKLGNFDPKSDSGLGVGEAAVGAVLLAMIVATIGGFWLSIKGLIWTVRKMHYLGNVDSNSGRTFRTGRRFLATIGLILAIIIVSLVGIGFLTGQIWIECHGPGSITHGMCFINSPLYHFPK